MAREKDLSNEAKAIRVRMDALGSVRELCEQAGFKVMENTAGTMTSTRLSFDMMRDLGIKQPQDFRALRDAELVDMALHHYAAYLQRFIEYVERKAKEAEGEVIAQYHRDLAQEQEDLRFGVEEHRRIEASAKSN